MASGGSSLSQPVEAELYLLLEAPQELSWAEVWASPLPREIAQMTIEASLWSAEEKARLRSHWAHARYGFSLGADPVADFIEAYRKLLEVPGLVGVANPEGATAHTAVWIRRLFEDGLEEVARACPPLHLWTGLVPVQTESSWEALLEGRTEPLWLRTVGYRQFGVPDLAHPMRDLRETGWIHSIFEGLFDWMYYERGILEPGVGIEIPARGRFRVAAFGVPGVLALWPYEESDSLSSAGAFG